MRRVAYLFDPLCGWCYGASHALEGLVAQADFTIDLVPPGLFAGEGAFAMNTAFAAHAWQSDQRIARLSGQHFSEDYRANVLGSAKSKVDSGPANLALTAVRQTAPAREFETLQAIQHARYVEGRDNGDPAVIADVLAGRGLAGAAARFHAADAALVAANDARIAEGREHMRRFNVRGVPTLIAQTGRGAEIIDSSMLYGDLDALSSALRAA